MVRLIILISVGLFLVSLQLPAFYTEQGREWWGIFCLLFGWIEVPGLLTPGKFYVLSWIANPFILFAWLALNAKEFKNSLICSLLAVLFCLTFLVDGKTIIRNESGDTELITGCGIGFFIWLSSAIVMLLGSGLYYLKPPKQKETEMELYFDF